MALLIGLDEVLWPQLVLTTLFWLVVVVIGRLAWLRRGRAMQRDS
ncbi:hypothetical protein [Duganella sp. CF517]|nr:hypothetical protein [Duganella sp. CF517]